MLQNLFEYVNFYTKLLWNILKLHILMKNCWKVHLVLVVNWFETNFFVENCKKMFQRLKFERAFIVIQLSVIPYLSVPLAHTPSLSLSLSLFISRLCALFSRLSLVLLLHTLDLYIPLSYNTLASAAAAVFPTSWIPANSSHSSFLFPSILPTIGGFAYIIYIRSH